MYFLVRNATKICREVVQVRLNCLRKLTMNIEPSFIDDAIAYSMLTFQKQTSLKICRLIKIKTYRKGKKAAISHKRAHFSSKSA